MRKHALANCFTALHYCCAGQCDMLVSYASKLCCVYIASQEDGTLLYGMSVLYPVREVWYECDVRGGRYGMSVMYPVSVMSGEGGMV